MNEVSFIISGVAFALACIGAAAGFTAIALVIGLKNSTHSIQWKEVEPPVVDPFAAVEDVETELDLTKNPNKRMKIVPKEEFADLDNPEVSSNEW